MQGKRNIAARMGRWSAQHRKKAIFGWLAFVVIAFAIGGAVGTKTLTIQESGVGQSGNADKAAFAAFPKKADESVLVQSAKSNVDDARFQVGVADVVSRLQHTKGVTHVQNPYAPGGQLSADRHSALVKFEIRGDVDKQAEVVGGSVDAVKAAAAAHPALTIEQFGDASSEKEISTRVQDDLGKAEMMSLPVTLLILVVAFGALMAAGVPLLLAISGVMATFGLVGPISAIAPVDGSIKQVILLIGLAVGVDYSLFYVRRVREERAAGRSEEAALEAAAATSGRAVLISAFTVMIAMAGMYLAGAATFVSFATGAIAVVFVSMIGSLTVLPAVLSKLGGRIEKGRVPLLGRLRRRTQNASVWSGIVDRVMRRPLLSAVLSGGLLIALAIPALGMHTETGGIETLPQDLPAVATYHHMQKAFPSEGSSLSVVVQADDVTAPQVKAGIAALERKAGQDSTLFQGEPDVEVSPDKSLAQVNLPTTGDGTDDKSYAALDSLRDEMVPATLGSVDGVRADVTGQAAQSRDFNDTMVEHVPYAFGFVIVAAFLLLLFTFRSLVIPIKAIVLNLLSVGAAYGVLVLVFQHGWGESLLNFHANGGITPWVPLFLFVVLFGLSMDYHVFILTRVREAYDRGMSTDDAVAHGIKTTAGVVTSAAVVMVAVFALFATLSFLPIKQMGVGLAVAVLLDATIVRGVLLPATMKLLGDRNWWLPKRLDWLPKLEHEPVLEPARA